MRGKSPEADEDGDSLLSNAKLAAGAVSSIFRESDLKRSGAHPVEEALALSLQVVASVSSVALLRFDFILGLSCVLTLSWASEVATHLKSLAKRARSNEGHVKAARVYKARVSALFFLAS